jgi:glycine hydroxymethyltransferase
VFGDKSAISPGGIRLGTAALTTRGFKENDFVYVGYLLHECIQLALEIQKEHKPLKAFVQNMENYTTEIENIKSRVNEFASKFEFITENN